jgi:EpsI family protein
VTVQKSLPYGLALLMFAACLAAYQLRPRADFAAPQAKLAEMIPERFGDWHEIPSSAAVIDPTKDPDSKDAYAALYDDVLMRAYQDSNGNIIMLALAYGRHQRQEFKIHRPELCYVAQGFRVIRQGPANFQIARAQRSSIPGSRMIVQSNSRVEAVSYWIRIGDIFSDNAWATRYHLLKEGLRGHILDGILVRSSQIVGNTNEDSARSYQLQEEFLSQLVRASPPVAAFLLTG